MDFLMFTYDSISYGMCLLGLSARIMAMGFPEIRYPQLPWFIKFPSIAIFGDHTLDDAAAPQGPLPAGCAIFATNQ